MTSEPPDGPVDSVSRRPHPSRGGRGRRSGRGQSITEFALVIPILLILFVALADFARVFAAGIAVESATREAAEAAANQYLSKPPGPLDSPAPSPDPSYYAALHTYAASVVCAELRGLPNTNFDSGTQTCPDMPVVEVCVHDSADSACDTNASPGSGTVPAGCGGLQTRPTNTHGGSGTPRWVEVRTCYHFTTILNTTIFSFGDFWLQRTRNFTIPCYFARGTDECG